MPDDDSNSNDFVQGWVSSPDGRGTLDIIQNCLFTISLCTWSALHLNIPATDDSYPTFVFRKARWMLQTLLGPEFVVWLAVGQRYEARESVRKFKEIGYDKWSLRHAFYANMGGIHLSTTDCKPFPITARQIHYLVSEKHMPFPDISMSEVWDKSKADIFTKFVVCEQIFWFVVQVIRRLIQHLHITTLELLTLSYVICTFSTYYMWLHKPLDVETPNYIRLEVSMNEILVRAGPVAAEPYKQNPLDFVDNQAPCWWINVQKYLGFRVDPRQRPLPRFTNDKFPMVGIGLETICYFVVTHAFAGVHLAGWGIEAFPTYVERVLWRTASLVMCGCMVACWALEGTQEQFRRGRIPALRRRLASLAGSSKTKATESGATRCPTREEAMAHPDFIPFWEFVGFILVALIYSVARLYVMAEVFASLRSLPRGAFDSVEWSNYLPHV